MPAYSIRSSLLNAIRMASLCGVAFILKNLNATPDSSPKDFKGLNLSLYDEQTGKRYLRLSYDEAVAERKKLGFLQLNLAFLNVRNLKIEIDPRHIDAEGIVSLFEKVSKTRGIRYAVAEPMELLVITSDGKISVQGEKGKFSKDGSLKLWGNALLISGKKETRSNAFTITILPENHGILFSEQDGSFSLRIPLRKNKK